MATKPKITPETTETDTVDLHELVRVRDKVASADRTVTRATAADKERYRILPDKRAVNGYGQPLKPKPVVTLNASGAKPDGATPSVAIDTTKEN